MSVEYVKRLAGPYVGDGTGQKTFSFGFLVFEESDVYVAVASASDSEPEDLQQGTDYTVSMNSDQSATPGGTITLTSESGLAKDAVLVIGSAVDYTQTLDLTNYTRFAPERITTELDRIVVMIQQIVELLGRVVQVPPTSSISPVELFNQLIHAAEAAAQAAEDAHETLAACEQIKQYIAQYSWDIPHLVGTIKDVENYPFDGYFWVLGFGDAGEEGQDISNRLVKTAGSTAFRTLGERFADIVNVKDFGAVGDGATDDTEAFKKASQFAACGAVVYVPTGTYVLSESVSGVFISNGRVETSHALDVIDLNSLKTRQFVENLDLSMLFTLVTPKDTNGNNMALQGFCSDDDDVVFICFRAGDHSSQKIIRYVISTGEITSNEFTDQYHVNSCTYFDGRVYVTPMSNALPDITVLDANTLEILETFSPEGLDSVNSYSIAYDSFTNKFYVAGSGKVWIYTIDWKLIRSYTTVWPDWAPATGQSFGAYKGMLFVARSGSNPLNTRYEAIIVWDAISGKELWHWFIGGSFGELEDVAFFRNKILLGFNDGSNGETPFYVSVFDLSLSYLSPLSMDEIARRMAPNFGKNSQEYISIYCDADAGPAGNGSQEKPFNSLLRALWHAKRYATRYNTAIYIKGDFSVRYDCLVIQDFRYVYLEPWGDVSRVPPLRFYETKGRVGKVTVKGIFDNNGTKWGIYGENSDIELRSTAFDPSESGVNPTAYVYGLRGAITTNGLDFSLCGNNLPTTAFCVTYSSGALYLTGALSGFKFPTGSENTKRFYVGGLCFTQYADCRGSISCNVYNGSKLASLFDGDGLGGAPTVNTPE